MFTNEPPSQTPLVVLATHLEKSYKGRKVVDSIQFFVHKGECFGLLGPNGAGKSTTLRMLTGLTTMDAGSLQLFGQEMGKYQRSLANRCGVVPQDENLDPDLTVRENMMIYGHYFAIPKTKLMGRCQELLHFAQLADRADATVRALSGGMRRRLLIARSLINEPELVILDEPTTGLDPAARHSIWQRLRSLRDQGITLILTTHYMEEAERLCDRLLILDQGKILAIGSPRELIDRHVEPSVVEIRWRHGEKGDLEQMICPSTYHRKELIDDTLYCYSLDPTALLMLLGQQTNLSYLHRPANLEDVFLKLTGRELRD